MKNVTPLWLRMQTRQNISSEPRGVQPELSPPFFAATDLVSFDGWLYNPVIDVYSASHPIRVINSGLISVKFSSASTSFCVRACVRACPMRACVCPEMVCVYLRHWPWVFFFYFIFIYLLRPGFFLNGLFVFW